MANPYAKQTWTDGVSQTTAARLGVIEQGIYDAHFQPAAAVFHSANQSIATGTLTALAFDSERVDQDGLGTSTIHDNVTNNSRLTCRVAGIYLIAGTIEWASNATGNRGGGVKLNATTFISFAQVAACGGGAATVVPISPRIYQLAVNDYVELFAFQTSGGNLNATFTGNYAPSFEMARLG